MESYDLADIIAGVVGKPIDVREIDADAFAQVVVGDVDPTAREYKLRVMRAITARYSSHDFVGNPNVLTWLLGRAPRTFEDFVRSHYEAFLNGPSTR